MLLKVGMRRGNRGLALLGLAVLGLTLAATGRAQAEPIVALTTTNRLLVFDNLTPGTISNNVAITGLTAGDSLVGIDLRPRDGQIYAVATSTAGPGRLYTLNVGTGAATSIAVLSANAADTTNPFAGLVGTAFGIDFNPVPDTTNAAAGSLRLVDTLGNNYRINANNGQVFTDTSLDYTDSATAPTIASVAYQNNVFGATTTTLRGVDSALDVLSVFASPNDGTLTLGTALALPFNTTDVTGYDISAAGGIYFSTTAAGAAGSEFFEVVGGQFVNRGTIGGGATIRGITAFAVPEPASVALLGIGTVVGLVALARRKRAATVTD